jgi:hypothetical protein
VAVDSQVGSGCALPAALTLPNSVRPSYAVGSVGNISLALDPSRRPPRQKEPRLGYGLGAGPVRAPALGQIVRRGCQKSAATGAIHTGRL